MWQLDNQTAFAANRSWTRGRDGTEIWMVAVKCTFDIDPDGHTSMSALQPPVTMIPEYMNPATPGQSSLKYDLDVVRTKTTTDIVVLGHAHGPAGRPVRTMEVGFRVGPVQKRLRVTGDRVWKNGAMSRPEPFLAMPLVYERAFGGRDETTSNTATPQWDTRNPVGCGYATSRGATEGAPLPNIEYPNDTVARWKDRPAPAGFAPLCSHWEPRARYAGTYDERWEHERLPLLPDDFDDRFYQCAPPDQQAPQFLTGGEPVVLLNLTPSGEVRFTLPRVFLGLETFFTDGRRQLHDKPHLHTVILEPDSPRVSLVWHSALPCHPRVYKLSKTRIVEKTLLSRAMPAQAVVA